MSADQMKLIFVCPNQNKVFETADYRIVENKGVITDTAGNKALDAKVVLNAHCPYCCQKHIYHVSELSCPFSG